MYFKIICAGLLYYSFSTKCCMKWFQPDPLSSNVCYVSIAQLMHRDHNITQKLENASFLLLFSSWSVFFWRGGESLFAVGRFSVVVYRSLLQVSMGESVVREGMLRPRSSGRSASDWVAVELLHCALCGNCNHTLSRSQPVT